MLVPPQTFDKTVPFLDIPGQLACLDCIEQVSVIISSTLMERGGPIPTWWKMLVTSQTFHRTVPVLASPVQLAGWRVIE